MLSSGGLPFPPETTMMLGVAAIFLTGCVASLLVLLVCRIARFSCERRASRLRCLYKKVLNKVVVHERFSGPGNPDAPFEFHMAELRLIAGDSRFARQVLLTQILELKKSVTGRSAEVLLKVCYAMQLERVCFWKLGSRGWQKRALAIRELAQMGHTSSAAGVAGFLYSKNEILREESLMAMVALEDRPLSFLTHYKGGLSLWMRLNIYAYLQRVDHKQLPVFSAHFNHPDLSVRLFSISMARRFKQTASLPGLVDMLYSDNAQLVGLAISAVEEMEAFSCREHIVRLALHVWRFEKLSERVVRCLGVIGDKEEDVDLLAKFLDHPSYAVRFQAAASLKKMGAAGEELLQKPRMPHQVCIQGILLHLSEPLLA